MRLIVLGELQLNPLTLERAPEDAQMYVSHFLPFTFLNYLLLLLFYCLLLFILSLRFTVLFAYPYLSPATELRIC